MSPDSASVNLPFAYALAKEGLTKKAFLRIVAQKRQHAIVKPMGNERILSAIDRLDRAFARVEAAVGTLDTRRSAEPAHDKLLERHRILRGQVEAAITRIDTLIASAED